MRLSTEANREKARAAEEQFENSDFLRELKRRSDENREKCVALSPVLSLIGSVQKQESHRGKVLPKASGARHRRLWRIESEWSFSVWATDPPVLGAQEMPDVLEELKKAQD